MESIEVEAISKSPQTPKLRQQLKLVFLLCLAYCLLTLGILCILLLVPSSPSSSDIYYTLYFTHNFEPFKIIYYFFLLSTGSTYASSVVLKNYLRVTRVRQTTFDTIFFYLTGLILFLLGSNATLLANSSETSYVSAIVYNYCSFTLPFIAALHITYLLSGLVVKVSIVYGEMWKWTYRSWVFLGITGFVIVGLIGYQFYLLVLYNRAMIYGVIYGVIGFVGIFFIRKIRERVEISDYFWLAPLAIPLTATPAVGSAVLQGICLGIYTEGAARVGFRGIFIEKS